jgi:hypothetical protein
MTWDELSADKQEAEMRSMARHYPAGSVGAVVFGIQYGELDMPLTSRSLAPRDRVDAVDGGIGA